MVRENDLVIRGGHVVTPNGVVQGDLAIHDSKIVLVGENVSGFQEIDATGKWAMPGVMNADTFETATRSAAMDGTTSMISFAGQAKGEALAQTVVNYSARRAWGYD